MATSSPTTTLDVNGSAQFGEDSTKSTFSATGALTLAPGRSLTTSGAGGTIVSGSSVTASAFFGDGSHLTGITSGAWILVSSAVAEGASSQDFTGLGSTTSYRLIYNFKQNSSNGYLKVTFNSDTGTNYRYGTWLLSDLPTTGARGSGAGANFISLQDTGDNVVASGYSKGIFYFETAWGSPKTVFGWGDTSYLTAGSIMCRNITTGNYAGASNLSSMTLTASAGTFSGLFVVQRLVP